MIKRRVKVKFPSLKVRVKWTLIKHVIHCWKELFEGYKIFLSHSKKKFIWKKYECPKFLNDKSPNFGNPIYEFRKKVTFECSPHNEAQNILYGPLLKGCKSCKPYAWSHHYYIRHIISIQLTLVTFFSLLCKLNSFWTLVYDFILVPSQNSNTPSYLQNATG